MRKIRHLIVLLVLVAIAHNLILSPASYAQGPVQPRPAKSVPTGEGARGDGLSLGFNAQGDALDLVQRPEGPITAIIVLEGEPAAAVSATYADPNSPAANQAALNRAATLRAAQRALSANLAANFNITTLGSTTLLSNTLIVNMDGSQLEAVRELPGVRAAVPDQIGYLDNKNSVPFIGTPVAWALGLTGQGMRIGIIDSGVDYIHTNFGGGAVLANYPTNPGTYVTDARFYVASDNVGGDAVGFDNSKVVGGYDFVGTGWAGGALLSLRPGATGNPRVPGGWLGAPFTVGDDDPWDCNGHGSHVAGTAAGFGVNGDGTTYAGAYPPGDINAMRIGPGVAPEAEIFALKIGDCSNSVSFAAAILALEVVMDANGDGDMSDRLDVTNNSYGGAYGTPFELLVQAFDLASANDVVMVGSAGNEGDTYFINGDPSIAASAISVASSVNDTVYGGLRLDQGVEGVYTYPAIIPANPSQGGLPGGPWGSYPLRMVGALGGGNSQGCNIADYDGFNGEAGLIVWTGVGATCGSGVRMNNAVNAVPVVSGLVVVSANPADYPFINLACTYLGGPAPIPCVSITGADGANLAANPAAYSVTFDSSFTATLPDSLGDLLSGFSSRGPSSTGGVDPVIRLKPDVAAPGDSITSTDNWTGNGATTFGGTSMASPHVAGMVALLRELHPTWSPAQIKALVMNTATHDLWTDINQSGDNYGLSRVGAGRVDVAQAVNSSVIAYDATCPECVSVSYGLVEVVNTAALSRTITVRNLGETTRTYNVSFDQRNDVNGATFTVSPPSVTVPAGGTATITVTLNANKAAMVEPHLPDPTTPEFQQSAFGVPLPRHWFGEEGGYVVLTNATPTQGVPTLRVPVHAAVRPASAMAADGGLALDGLTGAAELPLAGEDVFTGVNLPYDIISQVSAFEVVYENETPLGDNFDSAHLRYVGITSDYPFWLQDCGGDMACAIANTTIYVALVTHADWNPATGFDTWFDVGFDVDEDDSYDYTVFNFESGYLGGLDFTDTVLAWTAAGGSWLMDGGSPFTAYYANDWDAATIDTYIMNTNVIVLPVSAADLDLDPTNTSFQFDIYSLKNFYDVDWIPTVDPFWFTYDITTPVYSFTDLTGLAGGPYPYIPMWSDLDGSFIPVDYDVTAFGEEGPYPPILLLHHHNAGTENRAELVEVAQYVPPAEEPGEGEEPGGVPGGAAGLGEPEGPTVLPSTGYPPSEEAPASSNLPLILGLGALVFSAGGLVIRRRMRG